MPARTKTAPAKATEKPATKRALRKTTSKKTSTPTAVTVDDVVIAETRHIDIDDPAAGPGGQFQTWLREATDEQLGERLADTDEGEMTAILEELERRDTLARQDADELQPADGELVVHPITDTGAMEAFLGGADHLSLLEQKAAADAQARRAAGQQWSPEEPAATVGGVESMPLTDALAVSAETFEETGVLAGVELDDQAADDFRELQPSPEVAAAVAAVDARIKPGERPYELIEGEVLDVAHVRELRAQGHRSPLRVYGTPMEQARQATAWGYDGHTYPTQMAPDAGDAEWAAVAEEEQAARAHAAQAAELAQLVDATYRTVSDHPATWSTEDGADPTVCIHPGCGAARNQHVDVPTHVPTAAEWAETLRRASEGSQNKVAAAKAVKEQAEKPAPRPKAAPVTAADPTKKLTLDLTDAELALAWVTLGRFGYRAFDSWGDEIAPFDYASGESLPDKPTLPANRVEALHKALVDHGAWLEKAKKKDADRVASVTALATKVAGLLS